MADIDPNQLLRLFETLGELREGMAALHRAVEAATRSNVEMVSQQSSRIDRQVEKLDIVAERVSENEKKIEAHDSRMKDFSEKIKIIDELDDWRAGQTGTWNLMKQVIPWILTIGTIFVVIYQTHYEKPEDSTNQSAIVENRYV